MIEENEKNVLTPKTITGKYGAVKTRIESFGVTSYRKKPTIEKSVERFSYDGDLHVKITNELNIDDTEETFSIEPKLLINDYIWGITLTFRQDCTLGESFFRGVLGASGINRASIPNDIYAKIRSIVAEICNPDFEYGNEFYSSAIGNIIDLLRECNSKDIDFQFLRMWDIVTQENKTLYEKTLKNNDVTPKNGN